MGFVDLPIPVNLFYESPLFLKLPPAPQYNHLSTHEKMKTTSACVAPIHDGASSGRAVHYAPPDFSPLCLFPEVA